MEGIGYQSVKSASRMNKAVVIFLDCVEKVNQLVETGLIFDGSLLAVSPLVTPAKRVIISNAPPFLSNECLARELRRHGRLVSPITRFNIGADAPEHVTHVVSFRRQVYMTLDRNDEELSLVFKFKIDNFDYSVYITSGKSRCFACQSTEHQIKNCPDKMDYGHREETVPPPVDSETDADTQPRVDL